MEIWKTKSGYEAGIIGNARGQWTASTRKIGETSWIEIGAHYSTQEIAREEAERLAEKYNEDKSL